MCTDWSTEALLARLYVAQAATDFAGEFATPRCLSLPLSHRNFLPLEVLHLQQMEEGRGQTG